MPSSARRPVPRALCGRAVLVQVGVMGSGRQHTWRAAPSSSSLSLVAVGTPSGRRANGAHDDACLTPAVHHVCGVCGVEAQLSDARCRCRRHLAHFSRRHFSRRHGRSDRHRPVLRNPQWRGGIMLFALLKSPGEFALAWIFPGVFYSDVGLCAQRFLPSGRLSGRLRVSRAFSVRPLPSCCRSPRLVRWV